MTALDGFDQAAALVGEYPDFAAFHGGASADSIATAERLLDARFPASYRAFLTTFGVGSFGDAEFYGIVEGKLPGSSVPSMVWRTLEDRKLRHYPAGFVTVMSDGDGALLCFDGTAGGEPPILLWRPGTEPGEEMEVIAACFGDFFLTEVSARLE